MSDEPVRDRSSAVLTSGTYIAGGLLVALTVLYGFLNAQMYAETLSEGMYNASYIFGMILQPIFAAVILWVAFRIGAKQNPGRQWLLIGIGVAFFAIGDVIWGILELGMGLDPFPSIADVFYVLEYPFFFAALVVAIRSYRGLTNVRIPLIVGAGVAIAGALANYALLLGPYIFPAGIEELGFWGLVVSTIYPLGDVFLILAPAVTLALVIRQLGSGRLGWPWWVVVAGGLVFSLTDSFYSYADWSGMGLTSVMDMGWMTANLLFAIAALVARDVYRSRA